MHKINMNNFIYYKAYVRIAEWFQSLGVPGHSIKYCVAALVYTNPGIVRVVLNHLGYDCSDEQVSDVYFRLLNHLPRPNTYEIKYEYEFKKGAFKISDKFGVPFLICDDDSVWIRYNNNNFYLKC